MLPVGQIQFIAWNKVQLYKKDACDIGKFTPPKVTQDMVKGLNGQLYELARAWGELFVGVFREKFLLQFAAPTQEPKRVFSSKNVVFAMMVFFGRQEYCLCRILSSSAQINISQFPQLHADSPSLAVFSKSSTVLIRDFPDTCAYPANAKGIPYCLMVPGKVTTNNGTVFTVNQDQIASCRENIAELVERLVMMEIDG